MSDSLFPNEFHKSEKVMWCNELGSMLMREHLMVFERTTILPDADGTYTLPDNINSLDVDRIIANGKVIRKKDGRFKGITYLSAKKGYDGIPISFKKPPTGSIDIVYRKKYEDIRTIYITTEAIINNNTMTLGNDSFEIGDYLEINTSTNCYYVYVTGISHNSDGKTVLEFDQNLDESGNKLVSIIRYLTEKTVVDSPYDMLYIDFLNAKYCFYQRDYENYNAHMAAFNSRLADLDLYLAKAKPSSPDTVLRNWF